MIINEFVICIFLLYISGLCRNDTFDVHTFYNGEYFMVIISAGERHLETGIAVGSHKKAYEMNENVIPIVNVNVRLLLLVCTK